MKIPNHLHLLGYLFCWAFAAGSAAAHHSFPAQYDISKQETVEGMVTKVEWRNPHVYFYMDVFNEQGEVEEWGLELANVSVMRNQGWTSGTLKAGDLIVVSGSRARDNSLLLNATKISRAEGESLL